MSFDIDSLALDRVFQPAANSLADRASCFTLSRVCLGLAVAMQFAVLAADLQVQGDPLLRVMAVGITLLALVGAQQARHVITRAERAARSGMMNVRRITMRWQRMAWLAIGLWSATVALTTPNLANVAILAACAGWLSCIYFLSCTPAPPRVRLGGRVHAFAR